MKAADTSLVVAAFASWHDKHDGARRALDDGLHLTAPAHIPVLDQLQQFRTTQTFSQVPLLLILY